MSAAWVGRSVRVLSGVVVLAAAGAVVLAGVRVPADQAQPSGAGGREVAVAPAASTLVCAGPLVLPEGAGSGDADFDPVPVDPVTTVTGLAARTEGVGAGPVTATSLDGSGSTGASEASLPSGGGAFVVDRPTTPVVVVAEPTDVPARVAATSSTLVTAGDLRGLTAASCQAPATESWLVGGATVLSSTAHLLLDNAGTTPAEVLLQVWGPTGPVDLTGERYLVAPGAQEVVVLGGVAAEQRGLVVRVQASGGRVTAAVQDSALDGFTPVGTDLVVPGGAPATRQVVPGVAVTASQVDDAAAPVLRLLAPGDVATTAHVTLLGADGSTTLPGVEDVALAPGEVTDVPLGGLPTGAWTIVVDSSEPVVAAAEVTRTGTAGALDDVPPVDRAWAASVIGADDALVALPARVSATVTVGAVPADLASGSGSASGTATLRVLGVDGDELVSEQLRIEAGSTLAVPVADLIENVSGTAAAVEVVGGDGTPLVWAVVLEVARPDGVLVSVVDPVPAGTTSPDVTVREGTRLTLP